MEERSGRGGVGRRPLWRLPAGLFFALIVLAAVVMARAVRGSSEPQHSLSRAQAPSTKGHSQDLADLPVAARSPHATATQPRSSLGRNRPPRYLTAYYTFKTTMIRDFNPFDPAGHMDWTDKDIYEPLLIVNAPPTTNGKIYPWLATAYAWSDRYRTLTFTIRHGLRWSDGQPFTAQDVAFTFNYGRIHAAADQQGLWAGKLLQSVSAKGDKVALHLTSVDTTLLERLGGGVLIVPQHIWSKVANPGAFKNPHPVGTGPFTQVRDFSAQHFVLARNRYYWQPLAYDGIMVPAISGADAASRALLSGQVDWTGNFYPDLDKTYVARDPAHFHYYYASMSPVVLFMNDQLYPYSLPAFRVALSHAIDRDAINRMAEYGYETPADASVIAQLWPSWADPGLAARAREEATYNPAKAKSILARAGFTLKGGHLYDPRAGKVSLTISVVGGWDDWVAASKILQREFQRLGIASTVNVIPHPVWYSGSGKGTLPGGGAHLHWTNFGATPYDAYFSYMSRESYTPVGQDVHDGGQANWERYVSPQATALLKQFRETTDTRLQHRIIHQVEAIQLRDMPIIPILHTPEWYTYSTLHFTGWPTPDNFYTSGAPWDPYSPWKVLTALKPVQ